MMMIVVALQLVQAGEAAEVAVEAAAAAAAAAGAEEEVVVVAVVVISNLTNKNDFSLSSKDTATPPLFPIKPRSPVGTLATRTSNTIKQYQTKGRSVVLHFVRSVREGRERTRQCEWPASFWRQS